MQSVPPHKSIFVDRESVTSPEQQVMVPCETAQPFCEFMRASSRALTMVLQGKRGT